MMTEKELEILLSEFVKQKGGIAYKFTSPGRAGVPDRLVLLPHGRIGFVEVKSPETKSKMRNIQIAEMKRINRLGFKCYLLNDPVQIPRILDDIAREKVSE